uniref:DUF4048 domain-containing protein n=1 Tax=Mycena chlorophos TaxID=658473 RepID=A0ABQ0LXQ0_MYCCL|nr:predicted protein [Mycena chlorophos]
MTYVIFGRAIPKQYLSMGTLATIAGVAAYSSSGKSKAPKSVDEAKQSVPLNAGSKEEEEFIRQFIAEAEKENMFVVISTSAPTFIMASSKRHSMPVPRPLQLASTLGDSAPSSPFSPASATTPTTPSRRPSSIIYNPPSRPPNRSGLSRSNSVDISSRRNSAPPETQRSPVTLAEKHKDLLEFIAQKEAKVLELRTQLLAHENELLQLKRKWERIVSRGFTSPQNASFASTSTSSGGSVETNPTSANGGAVLEGLREGVQGVGRLIASFSPAPYSSLDAVMSPTRRTHSTSSSTSTIGTSKSTRLSQSSTSSIEEETECPADSEGQVLVVVHDTGTTPTMSPSGAFSARRQQPRDRLRAHTPDSSAEAEADFFAANASLQLLATSTPLEQTRPVPKRAATTSTIPGLALVESVAPVSAWVDTVGKKWEELQRVPSVAKNTKRASLLLSDIASALQVATPPASSPSVSPSISSASLLDDDSSGDLMLQAPALTPAPVASLKLSSRMASNRQQRSQSPLSLPSDKTKPESRGDAAVHDDDDEEWNW